MLPLHPLFLGFLVALGVGLLIGIDRERKKGEGPPITPPACVLSPWRRCWAPSPSSRAASCCWRPRAGGRGLRRSFLLARARQRSRPYHRDGAGARDPAGRAGDPRTGFRRGAGRRHRRAACRPLGTASFRARRADRPGDPQPAGLRRRHPGGAAAAARPCGRTLRRAQPAYDLDRGDPGDGGERAGLHRGSPARRALRPAAGRLGRGLHLQHRHHRLDGRAGAEGPGSC